MAYYAWEASTRLAVAAAPPDDVEALAMPSVGDWVSALELESQRVTDADVRAAYRLLSEVGSGSAPQPRSVTPMRVLRALPAYRNKAVGHGAVRAPEFYGPAGDCLVKGLTALWSAAAFWPADSSLVYVESIEDTPAGPRARVFDLMEEHPIVLDPRGVSDLPRTVEPRRLYLRDASGDYRSLHLWVLFSSDTQGQRVLFFNGWRRRKPIYLDYVSGEEVRGDALADEFPGIEAVVGELFSDTPSVEREEQPTAGRTIGDYEIQGELGRGAMGVVYLARQPLLDRLVAIKTLPAHLAEDGTAVARFRREIDALARCEHPNVVKVYASGVADERPYYSMELIRGANLGELSQALASTHDLARALSTFSNRSSRDDDAPASHAAEVTMAPERAQPLALSASFFELAELFEDAATGLQHLHEQGIVHRDIKPGNLMVTAEERRVVVMDLGLAAVADASQSLTQDDGKILGTLRYMPPEQLQRGLVDLDARVDTYALGATFYELFTGRPFFDGDTHARLIEQILHQDPVPVRAAKRSVPGDLARILEKATRKDPKLRYQTARALADDLAAFRHGRPISARPPSTAYLASLWFRRHRTAVASTGIGMAVAGSLGLVAADAFDVEKDPCPTRTDLFDGIWDPTTKTELGRRVLALDRPYAEAVWHAVEKQIDPMVRDWGTAYRDACEATYVRHEQLESMLDRRVLCLARRRSEIAALVDALGAGDPAFLEHAPEAAAEIPSLAPCADIETLAHGFEIPEDEETLDAVAAIRDQLSRASNLAYGGRTDEAVELATAAYDQALAIDYAPLVAEAIYRRGRVKVQDGRFEAARADLVQAYRAALASRHDEVLVNTAMALTHVLGQLRHDQELPTWVEIASGTIARTGNDEHRHARLLKMRGDVAAELGNYKDALRLNDEALEIFVRLHGEDHPAALNTRGTRAYLHFVMGEHAEAAKIYEDVLSVLERTYGTDHPAFAGTLTSLAMVLRYLDRSKQAKEAHERALAIKIAAYPPDHPSIGSSLYNLGFLLTTMGDFSRAEAYHRRAIAIYERAFGLEHPDVAYPLTSLGQALIQQKRPAEAIAPVERALAIRNATQVEGFKLAETQLTLGFALADSGVDPTRARKLVAKARAIYDTEGPIAEEGLHWVGVWYHQHGENSG